MRAPTETRECEEETASRGDWIQRWLAVSKPLAVDDAPDWEDPDSQTWSYGSST